MSFLVVAMLVFYCICESGARSWRREEFKSIYCFCLCRYITLVSKNIKKKYLSYKNIKRSFRWSSMQGCNARARARLTTLIWTNKLKIPTFFWLEVLNLDHFSIASYKQEIRKSLSRRTRKWKLSLKKQKNGYLINIWSDKAF